MKRIALSAAENGSAEALPCRFFARAANGTTLGAILVLSAAVWLGAGQKLLAADAAEGITGPRQLFELGGIGPGELATFTDGTPWRREEEALIMKMLYRIERDFRPRRRAQWSHGRPDLERLGQDAANYRGEIFDLSGRVALVERLRCSSPQAQRMGLSHYWRCRMQLNGREQAVTVLAKKIPSAWKPGEPIDEPAAAEAFFLKLSGDPPDRGAAMFLASRIAWYPPTPLGTLGMDVGLLDDVRMDNPTIEKDETGRPRPKLDLRRRQLTAADSECFYQMLAAAGRAAPGQLRKEAQAELARQGKDRFSVAPLFNQPRGRQGRLEMFSGNARRILKVLVDDPDIVARLGIDHYYQLYVFTDDSQANPLVFCVRELPPGMPTGDGPQFGEYVTVAGFFFKTWAYRIDLPGGAEGDGSWQLAPLLIGRAPQWRPVEPAAASPAWTAVATIGCVAVFVLVWWILWRTARADRRFRRTTLADQSAAADLAALDQIEDDRP